ncbi:MAG: Ig-like domain-containing protein, partial [bacterium]
MALQNLSNLDAPYTFFEVGAPQLNLNPFVYGLPYLEFATNVRGTPEGAADTANAQVPWVQLESITNTTGQLITSGYLFDEPADGFAGFSFNVITYPGLHALHERAFEEFRAQMASYFPDLDAQLAGGEGGLEEWWEAVKEKADEINPAYRSVLDQIDFVGMYKENRSVPGKCQIPFIPFRFHVFASATTMTRAEFVAHQSQEAIELRQAILQSDSSPGPLLALAADEGIWVDLYLAALEDAGLLRPEGATPPIRNQQHIVSLMSTLASGILFGPVGTEIRSDADLLGFFDQLRELYGHDQDLMAEIEKWDPRESECFGGAVPIPALPVFDDYNQALTQPTHFEAFRIYVPWIDFEDRGAGLPADFQINGPAVPVDGEEFAPLDFSQYFTEEGVTGRLVSLTGPQTFDTQGWLPVSQPLPYSIGFQNAEDASRTINEIRVVTQLDPDFDAYSFQLGDIKIGDITIDVPDGRSLFQGEYDFAATRGFNLRVSAGIDLYQDPAQATWLIQAIDPLTGEVLQDSARGLLGPNDALGSGAGFVSYTAEVLPETATGEKITASARVLFDTQAPEDTQVLTQDVDGQAPASQISVERIGTTANFSVTWEVTDDMRGSGFKHVTLYVAEDGGDFQIWQRKLTNAGGSLVFQGEAGHTYEFLALASDVAGNQERPAPGVNATADDSGVSLGALPTVPGTTPPDFGVAPEPTPTPSTNPLFTAAETGIPNVVPLTRPSEFDKVISPFTAQAFATGIAQSHADIGPMAIAEAPDGSVLISGGPNRGQIFRFDPEGGQAAAPWASLNEPVFNLAFDSQGRLWATSGGGALLQLNPDTGAVIDRFGDGITIALAVEPETDRLFVSTSTGVQTFDPATGLFAQYSRDANLRVGSLAFASDGSLWAVTWPDRRQVVRFTDRARAEVMLEFESDIDSLAFGRTGTPLSGLLFVSHNRGSVSDTALTGRDNDLTMVDVATLRRVAVATGGTRGDVVITTSDGRVLLSQSHQVDVINPVYAPSVVATNPPSEAIAPLPLPFISVTFDQDMFVGDSSIAQSVLNTANYTLTGGVTGARPVETVTYDPEGRTVLLTFEGLLPDSYTLTVEDTVASVFGLTLAEDYTTSFNAISDLSAYLDIDFGLTRMDRALGTVSYDVSLTNIGDTAVVLPVLLTLDPRYGYPGIPADATGQTDDGRWLIDLSAALDSDGRLEPGEQTTGRTISVATPDRRRVDFAAGITAGTEPNRAPAFDSIPPDAATVGETFLYEANAVDPDGQPVIYHLLTGPDGMSVDPQSGLMSWAVLPGSLAQTPVVLQAFDSRGALALQRFVLTVAGGNRPPAFFGIPSQVEGMEGLPIEFSVGAVDPDLDRVTVWADNLPAGATFDPETRLFSWVPGYDDAGTYPDVRFFAADMFSQVSSSVALLIGEGREPLSLVKPADRAVQEGDRVRFYLQADGDPSLQLAFSSDFLPWGATLHPETGIFEWTPGFTQAGMYEVPFAVNDGVESVAVTTLFTVTNANAAPIFDPQDGWQVLEGQPLRINAFAYDPDNPFYLPSMRDLAGELVVFSETPRTVTVTADALPPGASFDAETWDLIWTPTHLQAGTWQAAFTAVDDGDGTGVPLSDQMDVFIEVLNLNRPPELEAVTNVSVQRDGIAEVTVRATDPEGNPIALSATSEQPGFPLPAFMTFTDNQDGTGLLQIQPSAGDRGDHAIKIIARDDGDGGSGPIQSDEYVFVVSVLSANEPPVIDYLGSAVAVVDQPLQIPIRVSDMDQDTLSYAISGLPAGATVIPTGVYGQALVQWTPTASDVGTYSAGVTVTDSGNNGAASPESDTASFEVVVRGANAAPVLLPVGNQQATEGQLLTLQLQTVDPDGDVISFYAEGLPKGAALDPQTGIFTWVPALNQSGSHAVNLWATDGNASSRETIAIDVANSNQLPSFVPMIPQLTRENTEIRFVVVAADPDADPLLLSVLAGLPQGALFVPNRGEFVWTPGFDQAGDHVVTFAAQDPSGVPVTMDVPIRVADVDRAPVLNESDHAFLIGEAKSFLVAATDPDAGADLVFSAFDMPEGAVLDADTGLFSWTPGPGQVGEYLVTLQAGDGLLHDRQTIVLRASLEPVAPSVRIELTPSFPALPGQKVLVHAIADSLADIASLRLFVGGQEVSMDDRGRATLTAGSPGKVNLVAVATDADGIEGQAQTQLKVRDGADTFAPVVSFASTLSGSVLGGVTEIRGRVQDSNLDGWTLELAPGFSEDFVTLAAGETPLDGVLGTLDPRRLADGFYTLRLTATDISGRVSSAEAAVEANTAAKLGQYQRQETDLNTTLGGVSFAITRQYDSLEQSPGVGSFGSAWSLLGRDVGVLANLSPTGREHLGIFNAFADGTRVYLTLPTGERAGFSFRPAVYQIDGLSFYRPAWTADGSSGWNLASASAQLIKAGAHYYGSASGQAYNPASPFFAGSDYVLTAADGTDYLIDATCGTTEIHTPTGGRLFVSDSGITAENGEALRFVRAADGQVSRVVAPDGTALLYQYDTEGRLVGMRNLSDGSGSRYAYDQGLLVAAVAVGGQGQSISYAADGTVTVDVLDADLGGAAQFTGQTQAGDLVSGETDVYAFSIRQSEIDATTAGHLIVRVAITADPGLGVADPTVSGLTPLSVERFGDTTTALFAVEHEGLYRLSVAGASGSGSYQLALSAGGDVNLDGRVDGVDSAIVQSAGVGSDVTGDGVTDASDRQVMYANYGFLQNQGPQLAATLPSVLTHQDLPVKVDLDEIATDPDGDNIFYRIISADNGAASLGPGGDSLWWFTPTDGFTGPAFFEVVADDGFNSSAVALVPVTVSDAPLLSLDFSLRQIGIETGHSVDVQVIGDFADQADVELPFSYLNARVLDTAIATLTPEGFLAGLAEGTTIMVAERGPLTAATVVAVGTPLFEGGPIGHLVEIDAYPDSVALVPDGGSRQIIVTLDEEQTIFAGAAADGTRYFSGNTDVATVTPDGLIEAVSEGKTTVTVIHEDDEEVLNVSVELPQVGKVAVGSAGAIVQNAEGYSVAIGPGLLEEDATVTVTTLDETELARAVPPAFDFLGAFRLDVEGGELGGAIQAAVPVDASMAQPGEQVYFFQEVQVPDENGDFQPFWVAVDSGEVDANGVARTGSPPFPGLSDRGNVLVARSNVGTMSLIRMEMVMPSEAQIIWAQTRALYAIGTLVVPIPFSPSGKFQPPLPGPLGSVRTVLEFREALIDMMPFPAVTSGQATDLDIWVKWANGAETQTTVTIPPAPAGGLYQPTIQIPAPPATALPKTPQVTQVDYSVGADGAVTLTIAGDWFYDPNSPTLAGQQHGEIPEDARVVFKMGGRRVEVDSTGAWVVVGGHRIAVDSTGFRVVEQQVIGGVTHAVIELEVPDEVLLGLAEIYVERPKAKLVRSGISFEVDSGWISSLPVSIKNEGGFAFLGSGWIEGVGRAVEVIDTTWPDEFGQEQVVKQIPVIGDLGNMDTVVTRDLSQVFVATLDQGIVVIDAMTLKQYDVDHTNIDIDPIWIPGDGRVTALALDPGDRYLYAAGTGAIYVIDLDPGSEDFHKVTQTIADFDAPAEGGQISSLAVNADGTRLFAAVPDTMFAAINERGQRSGGTIVVINVDEDDRPEDPAQDNPFLWRKVIGELDRTVFIDGTEQQFVDPRQIQASRDPDRLLFTSFLDTTKGLHRIFITNNDPRHFEAQVSTIDLHINEFDIGTRSYHGYGWYGQYFDLDIWNAWDVAITSDLEYAFVGDWHVPESIRLSNYSYGIDLMKQHGVGSKIGVVKDPFGPNPKLLASTTPIPMTMLEDLEIDALGQKLYANFRGAGNIAVYDINAMIQRAEKNLPDYKWSFFPLDLKAEDYFIPEHNLLPEDIPQGYWSVSYINANLPAIDIQRWGRGLSLQPNLFMVTDASGDDSSETVFQHGVLSVSFSLPDIVSQLTLVAEPTAGGASVDLKTYSATAENDDLLNLYEGGLSLSTKLAPGTYMLGLRVEFTDPSRDPVMMGTEGLTVLGDRIITTGTFLAETFQLNWIAPLVADTFENRGMVICGAGGTDTLELGCRPEQVISLDGLSLADFEPIANSPPDQAVYQGFAYDYLSLADGREIYFRGIERLLFSNGQIEDLQVYPDDPIFPGQWGLTVTDVPDAWRFTTGSSDVLLVSLDEGLPHGPNGSGSGGVQGDDLSARLDVANAISNLTDFDHGHQAISIMSSPPNGYRVTGINWTGPVSVQNPYAAWLVDSIQNGINAGTAGNQRIVFQGGIQGESWLVDAPSVFATTLAVAINDATANIELANASPIFNTPGATTYALRVDQEYMFVTVPPVGNRVTVTRAAYGTTAAPHALNANVFLYTDQQLRQLLNDSVDNVLFAVAAGNGSIDVSETNPADPSVISQESAGVARLSGEYGNVIAVGALEHTSTPIRDLNFARDGLSSAGYFVDNARTVNLASYSNFGAGLTLVAPTDNPASQHARDVQRVIFNASFPSFTLTFGGVTSAPINSNASENDIRAALVNVFNANDIVVSHIETDPGTGAILSFEIMFTGNTTRALRTIPQPLLAVNDAVGNPLPAGGVDVRHVNTPVNFFDGTSAANPMLAGIASLVWSVNPTLTAGELRNLLTATAMHLSSIATSTSGGTPTRNNVFGFGLVDADAAVRRAYALVLMPELANLYSDSGLLVQPAPPDTGTEVGIGSEIPLTLESLELAGVTPDTAMALWSSVLDGLSPIQLSLSLQDLADGELGRARIDEIGSDGLPSAGTIILDTDAAGVGWFVDATPFDNLEFDTPLDVGTYQASGDSPAAGNYDLLTVLLHEVGHLLGFDSRISGFSAHVGTIEGSQLFAGPDFTAILSADAQHLDSDTYPYDLMNDLLSPSMRRLPSQLDGQIVATVRETASTSATAFNQDADSTLVSNSDQPLMLPGALITANDFVFTTDTDTSNTGSLAALPQQSNEVHAALINGDFSVKNPNADGFGWEVTGDVTVGNSPTVLREDPRFLTGLSQSFILPEGAQALRFTILDASFEPNEDGPPDAFEFALLDAAMQSLIGSISLSDSDAAFNVQSDGTVYTSPLVRVLGLDPDGKLESNEIVTVEADLSGIAAGTEVNLFLDLIGFDAMGSEVWIDNVRVITEGEEVNDPPVAVEDFAEVEEDGSVDIPVLANDSDPDGDPLTVLLVDGPAHGIAVVNPDGTVTYSPAANFFGSDSFTYRLGDGELTSSLAMVSMTVTPVNDVPVMEAISDAVIAEETVFAFTAVAHDVDLPGDALTFSLEDGAPAGAAIDPVTGLFSWTPSEEQGPGIFNIVVKATDAGGLFDSQTFSVQVDEVNQAPVLALIGDQEINEGEILAFLSAATDPDIPANALTFSLDAGFPEGAAIDPGTGMFTWTPTEEQGPGAYGITIRVSDDELEDFETVTITVKEVNKAPVLTPIGDKSITEGEELTFMITGLDSDVPVQELSFSATGIPEGATFDPETRTFRWIPTEAQGPGTYDATFGVSDGEFTDEEMVTIDVTEMNVAPIAVDDVYEVDEDDTLMIAGPGVLGNDSDEDENALSAKLISGPSNGSLTLNADGAFNYTPAPNFNGTDSFTYVANDGQADSNVAMVTLTVNPVNDAPVAADDVYSTPEDMVLNIAAPGVLANDSDVDGDALTAALDTDVSHGTLTLNGDGSFSYTPLLDYTGSDSFTYTVSDGSLSDTATVTITIGAANDAPVAVDDSATTDEDTAVTIDVAANDSDADGDPLTVTATGPAGHGTVTFTDSGVTYTPDENYNGSDSFEYTVSDGMLSDTATVTITVDPVNDAPVAVDDSYLATEDMDLIIAAPGVLANDTDVDGDFLTAVLDTDVSHGALTLSSDGSFTYTPDTDFVGTDTFTYYANDGTADSNLATVTISIGAANDAPVAVDDSATTDEDTAVTIAVLANDTDADGDPLSVSAFGQGTNGSVTLNLDQTLTYTPAANWFGADSFTYTASDGEGGSDTATVTITVDPVNDVPVAVDDAYTTDEDTPLVVDDAAGVLGNDPDVDGDSLSASLVSGPTNGILTLNANGGFTYTPDADFNGSDSFTYVANDGLLDSAAATVSIMVTPVNDAPGAADDAAVTDEDTAVTIDVAANDSDVDGNLDPSTAVVLSGPVSGTLTNNGDGTFTYSPNADFNGSDSFSYKISDTAGLSATATV